MAAEPSCRRSRNFYQEPDLSQISPQIDREMTAFGINGRWRPFEDECGTLLSRT